MLASWKTDAVVQSIASSVFGFQLCDMLFAKLIKGKAGRLLPDDSAASTVGKLIADSCNKSLGSYARRRDLFVILASNLVRHFIARSACPAVSLDDAQKLHKCLQDAVEFVDRKLAESGDSKSATDGQTTLAAFGIVQQHDSHSEAETTPSQAKKRLKLDRKQ